MHDEHGRCACPVRAGLKVQFDGGLQAQGGTALRWRIDGRPAGQGAALAWLPWPGRHRVELLDAQGQVQDSVQIEVRGAGVRAREQPGG